MTTRYQRGNQKPSIEKGQTTLRLHYNKVVIRRTTDNTMTTRYQRGNQNDRKQYDHKIP
jgi:hypothetical protein